MTDRGSAWGPWGAHGKPHYAVRRLPMASASPLPSDSPVWRETDPVSVACPLRLAPADGESEQHQPRVEVRVRYAEDALFLCFQVDDRYVRAVETKIHGRVWEDACVEFFVQPKPERGYVNFEINCGGTLLVAYHEHPDWPGADVTDPGLMPMEQVSLVQIEASMPRTVDPEIAEPVSWSITYRVPLALFEAHVGPLGPLSGKTWRANFYKCAENNSHPHWLSWAPIVEGRTFHAPRWFGTLTFE